MNDLGAVRVRLLGPVELAPDGDALGGPKQRLVLAILALHVGDVVAGDTIVDVVWAEDRPADPRRSLQVHVSKLRRVFDEAGIDASIAHRGTGYVLQLEPSAVDAHVFEALVDEGIMLLPTDPEAARQRLQSALSLWRGHPLGGLSEHPTARVEMTRLEDLRLRALESRIAADLATGRHDEVATELRRLTDGHPLREGLWGQLMLALYRSGRQGEALAAYERARRTLAEELGVDPSPALQELHARILQQDRDLDTAWAPNPASSVGQASTLDHSRRLAILPFEVIGDGGDAGLFALGLHNDLLTELSKVPELTVISRTSVLGYDGANRPIPAIARELNVGTVVEGTVQSAGRRFRLTVQLIDGLRDQHRWADNYDRELTTENLFAIQSDLARDIARALSAELGGRSDTRSGGPPTVSLDAYRLAAEARQRFDLKTEAGFQEAIERYEAAAELDPDYPTAWIGLADALASMEAYGHGDRHTLLPRAEKAVHRALALDLDSAEARTSLGVLHLTHQDAPAALHEFERARRTQPSYADAHNWHSWLALIIGRAEDGLASATRAAELDPLSAEAHAHLALGYLATGRPEEGLTAARQAQRYSPYTTADFYAGMCLESMARHEEALQVIEPLTVRGRGQRGVPWAGHGPDALFALCLSGLGDTGGARDVLDDIDPGRFPFATGLIHLSLGDTREAAEVFARLEHVTAWPSLAIRNYHHELWSHPAHRRLHRELLATADRSWQLGR